MIESPGRRLNFGCGYDKRPGYVNVDSDPACQPDVLLVNNDLSPLRGEPFVEILALDVLEHIPRMQTLAVLLEWADLMAPGAALELKTSSILGVAGRLAGERSFREQYGWIICLFGNQAHPGDFHLTGFTDLTLRVYLMAAGFEVTRTWLTDHWLLHAQAVKRASWTDVIARSADASDEEFVFAVYEAALERQPHDWERDNLLHELGTENHDRRSVCHHVFASPERLFLVADRNGFGPDPTPSLAGALRDRTPALLRPALRRLRGASQQALVAARRRRGATSRHRTTF